MSDAFFEALIDLKKGTYIFEKQHFRLLLFRRAIPAFSEFLLNHVRGKKEEAVLKLIELSISFSSGHVYVDERSFIFQHFVILNFPNAQLETSGYMCRSAREG